MKSCAGQKPLVLRYQSGSPVQPSGTAAAAAAAAAEAPDSSSAASPQRRPPQGDPNDPTAKPGGTGAGASRAARSPAAGGEEDESDDDSLMPAVNLSNRLNPNNVHFDRQLAAQYKRMSKHEKEALWAADRARQHQLRELTELSQMAGLNAAELSQLTELTQAAMLSQPGDLSSGLLTQLGNYLKPPTPAPGLAPNQSTWEGNAPPAGPCPAPGRSSMGAAAGMNGAALTGAASGLQAAAQSLLRQRMEALRQQGVGLRGAFTPGPPGPGQWEGQQPQQQQLPPMYPPLSQSPGYWPPAAPSMGRPAPPSLPQHMLQRNSHQPPIGPSTHMRAPGGQSGAFPGFQHQQALGLHLGQAQQQQQQQQPQDVQMQLQHALGNQARYSAEQQRYQLQRQSIDQMHPSSASAPGDPQSWTTDLPPSPARQAEQHRQLAELLAGSSLHQHDRGFSPHSNIYGGSQASHDHMHRLTSLGGASCHDQAHRLTSLGAMSSPEQPYRLASLGGAAANEHAYRLSSLGTASSADAMAAFRDSSGHLRQHPSGPDAASQEEAQLNQMQMHDWGQRT
ncbi:hypothetical protein ABBQ32_009494 [Trebouxia sp. C0010 RCD-2024]